MAEVTDSGLMPLIRMLHKALGIEGWSTEQAAAQNLASQPGGSIMANYQPPTAASEFLHRNPLLKTVIDMATALKPNPTDAAGASKAMISPGMWKSTEPEMKALMNVLGDRFPRLFSKVLEAPRDLATLIQKPDVKDLAAGLSAVADFRNMGDKLARIRMAPFNDAEKAVPVLAHEMGHYVHQPLLKAYSPESMEATANKIHNVLPKGGRGSLQGRLGQLEFVRAGGVPQELAPVGAKLGREGLIKALQQISLDEGFAYLTEHSTRRGAPQNLLDLANQFGVSAGPESGSLLSSVLDDVGKLRR